MEFDDFASAQRWDQRFREHIAFATLAFQDDLKKTFQMSPRMSKSFSAPVPKRASFFGGVKPVQTDRQSLSLSEFKLLNADKNMWRVFAGEHGTIVATALVNKPNPMGSALMRQIILTNGKKLLYIDAAAMELKGEISISSSSSIRQVCAVRVCGLPFWSPHFSLSAGWIRHFLRQRCWRKRVQIY